MEYLPLIGYLGIGALLKGFADHFLASKTKTKERNYNEKKETYVGLLGALRECAIKPSSENAKIYAYWQARCTIFASDRVATAAQNMIDTNSHEDAKNGRRDAAYEEILQAMREDLRQ